MALYHISDLHIRDQYREDLLSAVKHVTKHITTIDQTIPLESKYVAITGDVFNRKNALTPNNIKDFLQILGELSSCTKAVIVIPGEHDKLADGSNLLTLFQDGRLNRFGNVFYYFDTATATHGNATFHIIGNTPPELVGSTNVVKRGASGTHVALIHNIDHYKPEQFSAMDFTCAGHVHDYRAEAQIVYSGALIQQSINETIDKGFVRWDLFTKRHTFIRVPQVRGYVAFQINAAGIISINGSDMKLLPPVPLKITVVNDAVLDKAQAAKQEIANYANKTAAPIEYITDQSIDCTIQTFDGQVEEIRKTLVARNIDQHIINRAVDYHKMFSAASVASQQCKWKLLKMEWSGFMCYPTRNVLDFSKLDGHVCGVIAPNRRGKSSIVDALMYGLFGRSLRGNTIDVQNKVNKNTRVACVLHGDAPDGKSVDYTFAHSKEGNKAIVAEEPVPCPFTDEELLATVIMTQDRAGDFLNMSSIDQKKLLARLFGVDLFDANVVRAIEYRSAMAARMQSAVLALNRYFTSGDINGYANLVTAELTRLETEAKSQVTATDLTTKLQSLETNLKAPPEPPSAQQIERWEYELAQLQKPHDDPIALRAEYDQAFKQFDPSIPMPCGISDATKMQPKPVLEAKLAKLKIDFTESTVYFENEPKHRSFQAELKDVDRKLADATNINGILETRLKSLQSDPSYVANKSTTEQLAIILAELDQLSKKYNPAIKSVKGSLKSIIALRPILELERQFIDKRDAMSDTTQPSEAYASIKTKYDMCVRQLETFSVVPKALYSKLSFDDAKCPCCRKNKSMVVDSGTYDTLSAQKTALKAQLDQWEDYNKYMPIKKELTTLGARICEALKTAPSVPSIVFPHANKSSLNADVEFVDYVMQNEQAIVANEQVSDAIDVLRTKIANASKLETAAKELGDINRQLDTTRANLNELRAKRKAIVDGIAAMPPRNSIIPPQPWQVQTEITPLQDLVTHYDAIKQNFAALETMGKLKTKLMDCPPIGGLSIPDRVKQLDDAKHAATIHASYQKQLDEINVLRKTINERNHADAQRTVRVAKLTKDLADAREISLQGTNAQFEQQAIEAYMRAMDYKAGLPCMMLQQITKALERRINAILANLADFVIEIRFAESLKNAAMKVYIYTNTGGVAQDQTQWIPSSMASGYQQFVLSIAVRQALIQLSKARLPKFLIIDEGFGCLDQKNMIKACEYIPSIKQYFDFILIISHLDQTLSAVDLPLYIKYRDLHESNITKEDTDIDLAQIPVGSYMQPDGDTCGACDSTYAGEGIAVTVGGGFCDVCGVALRNGTESARSRHNTTKRHLENLKLYQDRTEGRLRLPSDPLAGATTLVSPDGDIVHSVPKPHKQRVATQKTAEPTVVKLPQQSLAVTFNNTSMGFAPTETPSMSIFDITSTVPTGGFVVGPAP